MNRLSAYALAFAVLVGTAVAALRNRDRSDQTRPAQTDLNVAASLALDGPYRDGLYLGHLSAGHGQTLSPPVGRWSNKRDRDSFNAGYRRGYNDVMAQATTATPNTE